MTQFYSGESEKEMARLSALRRYNLLDAQPNISLDMLTKLAANMIGTPIALMDLVDENRVWSKSHFGTEVTEYGINLGFCSSLILGDAPYIIEDAKSDPRTADHPLVIESGVRFYASVPLKTHDDFNIGTLCVIGFEPRTISDAEIHMLQALAVIAMETLEFLAKDNRTHDILDIEQKFKLKELQNQLILNSTIEGIHVIDLNGVIVVENSAAVKLLGREQGDLLGRHAHQTLHHHHADQSEYPVSDCPIYKTLSDAQPRNVTSEVFWRKDGSSFPVEYSTSPLMDLNGELSGVTVVFRDITDRKANEAKIQYLAYFDALTHLPNRSLFLDRLDQAIKKSRRNHTHLALIYIDLDRFKEINDTLGHDVGDRLLQQAANRLQACVRTSDTVARLGGDEFTITVGDLSEPGLEKQIVQKILIALAEPFVLNNEALYLSASIGVTVYPNDALTGEDLLKNADQSMYAAKKAGRNRYHYFTQSMQEQADTRLRLITDLHDAIKNKAFFLMYQPIMHLATGAINKAEALIRWQHPKKGIISPLEFIPVAEEVGLINEIGQWVFEESVRQVKSLQALTLQPFQMSVNKSPVQFGAADYVNAGWINHLKSQGLAGENICIEITEGLLLDTSKGIKQKLLSFQADGIQIALDDFGTGYSSLSYLNQYAIDYIKIDRSFVCNLAAGSSDYALCEAMIAMAHKLNIKVIAEGIETESQLRLLTEAGCDYGQGYYLSKPLNQKDFQLFLAERQKL